MSQADDRPQTLARVFERHLQQAPSEDARRALTALGRELGWLPGTKRWLPLHDNILVNRDPPVTKSGSIDIPEQHRVETHFGTVVALGPQVPPDIKVGDRVLFHPAAGKIFPKEAPDTSYPVIPNIFLLSELLCVLDAEPATPTQTD